MSDTVKLSAKLAKDDEFNGLDALADEMIDDPRRVRVGIVYFDCCKIVDSVDDDSRVPYARIRRFEPIGDVDEIPDDLQDLIQQAVAGRTGKQPLPFGQVESDESDD